MREVDRAREVRPRPMVERRRGRRRGRRSAIAGMCCDRVREEVEVERYVQLWL